MFEFSRMGLILFVTGVLFFLLFGRWLLPERKAQELAVTYQLGEYITELRVAENSPWSASRCWRAGWARITTSRSCASCT